MKANILISTILLTSILSAATSELTIRHRESQGVGYNQGYSSVDYFLSAQGEKNQFLFNLRAHLFNNAKAAGNIGTGWRYSFGEDSSRIGLQVFYDFRDYSHFFANQLGAGLEWISQNVDIRLNGYLPVGDNKSFQKKTFQRFVGNQVLIRQKFSAALPCIEGEIGTPLAKPFYFAAGTYYLFRETGRSLTLGDAWGAKLRFDLDLGHYITLSSLATYDPIFKTRVQGVLSINIPLGARKKAKKESQKATKRPSGRYKVPAPKQENPCRNLEMVHIVRNEIIPVQTRRKSKTPFALDSLEIQEMVFVNNQAPFGGDGTFEHPFSSLKEAEQKSKPGDIIYLFPGDGTARLMDQGIELKQDQILASSGAALAIEDLIIPAQTPGKNPVLTNVNLDEPVVKNPGKSYLKNFYFMSPWEYLGNYDFQSYSTEPEPAASFPYSPDWDDPAFREWVDLSEVVAD